jgi:hypothetical protein
MDKQDKIEEQDQTNITNAWVQTANLASNNVGVSGYKAWVNAACKAIASYNIKDANEDKVEYLAAALLYSANKEQTKVIETRTGLSIPKDLEKPSGVVRDTAINDKFVPKAYLEASRIRQESIAQIRDSYIYANENYDIFDIDIEQGRETARPNISDRLHNFSNVVHSLHSLFDNLMFGNNPDINHEIHEELNLNNNQGFVARLLDEEPNIRELNR